MDPIGALLGCPPAPLARGKPNPGLYAMERSELGQAFIGLASQRQELGMVSTQTVLSLYLQHTVEKTTVRLVQYDPEWLSAALGIGAAEGGGGVAGALWRKYYQSGEVPPADFGSSLGEAYTQLLEVTKAGCERVQVIKELANVKGADCRQFL